LLIRLRTFSKAYGLAGLRIGYGFCAPVLARRLWTMQPPFGVGITSWWRWRPPTTRKASCGNAFG
jgi:histidinol-phosphate/aromatic aminotransferase/cobyric acid decarboxylase-like protein